MENKLVLFWFRRDLRLEDNAGLYHALKSGYRVLPIFIFDEEILDRLEDKHDLRVCFIHQRLEQLHNQLTGLGSSLLVLHGKPLDVFARLIEQYEVHSVCTNHDYEPYAIGRDNAVGQFLQKQAIGFHTFKDQVIFETNEVVKDDGLPYTIFTPYSKKWKSKFSASMTRPYPTEQYFQHFLPLPVPYAMPTIDSIGFSSCNVAFSNPELQETVLIQYAQNRDFPAILGTSRLSVHLRFGTVSIRHLVERAMQCSETWLNELIWREFYMMILYHFPQVVHQSFKPKYDAIPWRNNVQEFEAWCTGNTGYPIVDAGMRELNATGFMHNRVRMIVASFLTKHLLIDWRWGEAYFAKKLLDFDLSANNGGWQWAAGTGCDAAPYFRVFNPYEQTKKFDPELKYVKMWVPELELPFYKTPIVDHKFARDRALSVYKKALQDLNN